MERLRNKRIRIQLYPLDEWKFDVITVLKH